MRECKKSDLSVEPNQPSDSCLQGDVPFVTVQYVRFLGDRGTVCTCTNNVDTVGMVGTAVSLTIVVWQIAERIFALLTIGPLISGGVFRAR